MKKQGNVYEYMTGNQEFYTVSSPALTFKNVAVKTCFHLQKINSQSMPNVSGFLAFFSPTSPARTIT